MNKFIHFLGTFYNTNYIQFIGFYDDYIQFNFTDGEFMTYDSDDYSEEEREALLADVQSLM